MRRATLAFVLLLATTAAADDFAYVFHSSSGGRALISGNLNLDNVLATRNRYSGEFLWVKRNGREYLIRDAATLTEARAAFAYSLDGEYRALSAKMEPFEKRERELDKQIDRLSDEESAPNGPQLRRLEAELERVEQQLRRFEAEEECLDAREEQLERAAEAKLRTIVDRAVALGAVERLR